MKVVKNPFKSFVVPVTLLLLEIYITTLHGLKSYSRFGGYTSERSNIIKLHEQNRNVLELVTLKEQGEKFVINEIMLATFGAVSLLQPKEAFGDETEFKKMDNFINLNETEPKATDICWLDVKIGDNEPRRLEISLFGSDFIFINNYYDKVYYKKGDVAPRTARNFKLLCSNSGVSTDNSFGYRGSEFFRVITGFSIQGGNISPDREIPPSAKGRYGKAAIPYSELPSDLTGEGFPVENYRILHSFRYPINLSTFVL